MFIYGILLSGSKGAFSSLVVYLLLLLSLLAQDLPPLTPALLNVHSLQPVFFSLHLTPFKS